MTRYNHISSLANKKISIHYRRQVSFLLISTGFVWSLYLDLRGKERNVVVVVARRRRYGASERGRAKLASRLPRGWFSTILWHWCQRGPRKLCTTDYGSALWLEGSNLFHQLWDLFSLETHNANVYRALWGVCRFSLHYLWKRAVRITGRDCSPALPLGQKYSVQPVSISASETKSNVLSFYPTKSNSKSILILI